MQGLADIKGTFSGFFDDLETKLQTAASSSSGIVMYLYPSSDAPTKYKCGPAWLDVSINVDVKGAVQVSGNFVANGSWANSTI